MSWLSKELGRSKLGKVINAIAKPVQAVANPFLDKLPVIGSIKGGIEAAGGLIPEIAKGSSVAGLPQLGTLGSVLGGNNGLNALAAAQGLNAANLGRQSTEYAKNAMQTQDDLWKQRAGLRAGGIEGLNRTPVQLPQLATLSRAGNPFAGGPR